MKTCIKCGIEKPVEDFYKDVSISGRDKTCKECRKKRVRENRKEKIEYYRDYDRERGNRHKIGYLNSYRKNNAIKNQAHNRVHHATISGKISKPSRCEECGEYRYGLHAHHDDYLKQLDVRWLCPGCHHSWHAKHGEAANSDHDPLPRGMFVA